MLRCLLPCLAAGALYAGMTDFHTLSKAKAAYNDGNYTAAAEGYGTLQGKNDAARFNYGDALYKQKKYQEAAGVFAQIGEPALKRQALHNLGNSLANLGKTDEAIQAYEASLKLGEDKDTRFNLELLKKQKEQQEQKKKQQNDQNQSQQNDQNQSQQDQKQQNGRQGEQDKKDQGGQQGEQQQKNDAQKPQEGKQNDRERQEEQKRDEQQKGSQQQQQKEEEQKQQQGAQAPKNDEKPDQKAQQAAMAEPISDMEERKYNQLLDKRGIKTLMIPLSGKGEPHEDETTPW